MPASAQARSHSSSTVDISEAPECAASSSCMLNPPDQDSSISMFLLYCDADCAARCSWIPRRVARNRNSTRTVVPQGGWSPTPFHPDMSHKPARTGIFFAKPSEDPLPAVYKLLYSCGRNRCSLAAEPSLLLSGGIDRPESGYCSDPTVGLQP